MRSQRPKLRRTAIWPTTSLRQPGRSERPKSERQTVYRGAIVKGPLIAAVLVLAAGTAGYAQDAAQTPQTPADPQAAAPARPAITPEERRRDIKMMEGILTGAVRNGASELGQRMQIAEPGSVIVTGTARARGIALDGYGVLFDVDVPMMKQSVIWTTRQLIQQDLRDKIEGVKQAISRRDDPGDES